MSDLISFAADDDDVPPVREGRTVFMECSGLENRHPAMNQLSGQLPLWNGHV